MLKKKFFRTMKLYKAQFISMIIMIGIGMGIFIGFNAEWKTISENTAKFNDETNYADYRIMSNSIATGNDSKESGNSLLDMLKELPLAGAFSKEDVQKIQDIEGVKEVSRYICVPADVKDMDGDAVNLTVTENFKVSGFKLMGDGKEYDPEDEDAVWLGDKYANANDIKAGDEITFVYNNMEMTGKVAGLVKASEHLICVRDETQLMPDYDTFGFAYVSPVFYKKNVGFEYYPQLNVISDVEEDEFKELVNEALGRTMMVLTKDETISYAEAKGEEEEGKTMGSVLPVIFVAIAVLTMVTTMHRLVTKEKTQIGILKALGFRDRAILTFYTSYALFVGIIGCVIGVIIGVALNYMIMNPKGAMGTYLDMPYWRMYIPWFCYVLIVVMIVLLTGVGYMSVKKMLRGSAAQTLRPYVPSKVKNLLLERTPFWKKLSFGTKWNLRDIFRHKSRTAMTLLGITGCMTIIVGSFGMKDTMDEYIDLYYKEAAMYTSCINLSENVDDDTAQELAEKYDGDTCAAMSVELKGDAVGLEIYDISHDMIRFMDTENNFFDIESDGAYICSRISKKYDVKEGDTIVISPYGTDDEYSPRVAGVISSMTESIAITSQFAKSEGISTPVTAIYTATQKEDITQEDAIKNVSSKQTIIDSFDEFMVIMYLMIGMLIVAGSILAIVVLYNLGVMSYTERYTEMATLKVVGFKDKRIASLLISQNMWITVVGIVIGMFTGVAALSGLIAALASEYELNIYLGPVTYIAGIAITFGVSFLVSFMVSRKNKNIDMVEALKGAE